MKFIKLLLTLSVSLLLFSCGNQVTTSGSPISALKTNSIYLVCDRELDSQEVHNSIKRELQSSGLRVIDLRDKKNPQVSGLILHYEDTWGWDLVTLIRDLDVRIIDGKTNRVISKAHYKQKATWPYPSVDKVVQTTFEKMKQP